MSLGLALSLLDAAFKDGGGTFYADGDTFDGTGFVVGGKAPTFTCAATVIGPASVQAWMFNNPSRLYGSWMDDGTIYIDAVDIFDDRDQAIEVGRLRGEKAIYDMAAGADIRLEV
jgi:hypothetical protein